jgi:hypothetical protein
VCLLTIYDQENIQVKTITRVVIYKDGELLKDSEQVTRTPFLQYAFAVTDSKAGPVQSMELNLNALTLPLEQVILVDSGCFMEFPLITRMHLSTAKAVAPMGSPVQLDVENNSVFIRPEPLNPFPMTSSSRHTELVDREPLISQSEGLHEVIPIPVTEDSVNLDPAAQFVLEYTLTTENLVSTE